jgi:hypothetical protein
VVFHPHPFPPPSRARVSLVLPYSPERFFITFFTLSLACAPTALRGKKVFQLYDFGFIS